jgi:ABC-type multidrug transport system fused ATPase/permease subunit
MTPPDEAERRQRPATLRLTQVVRTAEEEELDTRPLEWGLIRRLFGYALPYRRTCIALGFLTVLRSLQLPLMVWAIARVIGGPITAGDWEGTVRGVGGFLALALSTVVTFHFRQRLALQLGEAVVHDLRVALFAHLHRLNLGFFTRTKLGRIIGRMTSDVESVRSGVQDVLFISIVQGGQMLVSATLMLWYDWMLFSVVLVLAPLLWALNRYFRTRMSRVTREVQESFSRVTATLAESVNGIRVTQGFVRQDVNAGLFRSLIVDHARYNMNVARTSAVFVPLLDFNSQFFISALLLLGGWQALHQHAGIDDIIMFFFLAGMFFGPIQALGNLYSQALTAMAGAERVFHLLDTRPDWVDAAEAIPLPPIQGRVEFRGLTFGYDPARPVLHEVSFCAEPGQTIALVGHTGCGKSTVINLIAKFYLPQGGELLIDGHEVRAITSDSLHRQMGIVTQTNFLFSGTLMENIRLGRPAAEDHEVVEACRRLGVLDLIGELPDGLNTRVGEKGSGVSLGQRQLVCFARAMLADPRILILDEATSSVDAITETRLQRALETLLKGRTAFVIAHRLSTIRDADQVLVLDHGRIVERGTHPQLLAHGGQYAELYRQFSQAGDER